MNRVGPIPVISTPDEAELTQREFGFWLFLMSDAIIFGLLFATFSVMSHSFDGGPTGADLLSLPRAFTETMLLLFSTLAVGLASTALSARKIRAALIGYAATALLGAGFLALELAEFRGLIASAAGPDRSAFWSAFFALLGAHGLHVAWGLIWIVTLAVQLWLQGPTAAMCSRLHRLGQFWHFVGIVWIGIYSVVYLPALL